MVITQENGIIYWDGQEDVMIKVPPSFKIAPGGSHRLYGLCGTFDGDKSNDFMTIASTKPYTDVKDFTNKWIYSSGSCTETNLSPPKYEPNGAQQAMSYAETLCSSIDSGAFVACHSAIDRNPYKTMCMQDVLHCNYNVRSDCVCNALSMYSRACQKIANVTVAWRSSSLCRK